MEKESGWGKCIIQACLSFFLVLLLKRKSWPQYYNLWCRARYIESSAFTNSLIIGTFTHTDKVGVTNLSIVGKLLWWLKRSLVCLSSIFVDLCAPPQWRVIEQQLEDELLEEPTHSSWAPVFNIRIKIFTNISYYSVLSLHKLNKNSDHLPLLQMWGVWSRCSVEQH